MPDEQFKRNIAYKLRIDDILVGKPVIDNERFSFLELGDKKIIRVNVVGNIVEKYESEGEKQYSFVTIDDGSGQIKLKSFGDDIEKLANTTEGQTIIVIGVLRYFNNEVYINPEIIKQAKPEYLLVRKLETEKEKSASAPKVIEREKIIAIKDNILNIIKEAESNGGVDLDEIIMKIRNTSPDIINQEIKKMLEEGIIFEPRPGRVRYLG